MYKDDIIILLLYYKMYKNKINLFIVFILILIIILLFVILYLFLQPLIKPLTPTHLEEYYIYDVLHNDNNELIIVSCPEISPVKIFLIDNNNEIEMNLIVCPHNHTLIYKCRKDKYDSIIKLKIDEKIFILKCNKYPEFKNEIIMSLIVKDEDNYIIQWINYYQVLGITRFIIYDNSYSNTLCNVLYNYIKNKTVLLIEWRYKFNTIITGNSGQITHENHSIYAFQNSKYIGFFDVDEYVNPQKDSNINLLLDNVIKDNNLNINEISCLVISCKIFRNINNKPVDGYNFFEIYNCGNVIDKFREKSFCIPKNTEIFSNHISIKGKTNYYIDKSICYFNHYVFLNKPYDRMTEEITDKVDDSIMRFVTPLLISNTSHY